MQCDISKIAQLARLNLTAEEKTRLGKNLEDILSYVETLNSLDTSASEPMSHVLNLENVYREDVVQPSSVVQDVLAVLPQSSKQGSFFKVPKVIDEA